MITYEQRLNADLRWALREGSAHFAESNSVHQTLRKVTAVLDENGVPYAVAGTMALYFHGCRRFTERIEVLVPADHAGAIRENLSTSDVVETDSADFFRDRETGVGVRLLWATQVAGVVDGKPIVYPSPSTVRELRRGANVVNLPALIEMLLAAALSNRRRFQSLADVQWLVETLCLSPELSDEIDASVRDEYLRIWQLVKDHPAPVE